MPLARIRRNEREGAASDPKRLVSLARALVPGQRSCGSQSQSDVVGDEKLAHRRIDVGAASDVTRVHPIDQSKRCEASHDLDLT